MKADKTIENILDIIDIQDSEIKELQKRISILDARIERYLDFKVKQSQKLTKKDEYISRLEDKLQQVKSDYEIDDYSLNLDEIYKKGV